jgi:hypothetical protein
MRGLPSASGSRLTIWWSSTASSNGRGALGVAVDLGELDLADHDLLVGDAQPHVAGEVVALEEGAQRLREAIGVDDLAVVDRPVREPGADDALEASARGLNGGEEAAVDIESDGPARLGGGERRRGMVQLGSGGGIGWRALTAVGRRVDGRQERNRSA